MKLKLMKLGLFLLLVQIFAAAVTAYTPQYADDARSLRLRWKSGTVPIAISSSMFKQNPNIRPDSDVSGAIQRSLETWEAVANIKFQVVTSDKQNVSPAGKSGDNSNLITIAQTAENLVLFAGDAVETAARTRIFFNHRGAITEADIVLNPYAQFSTDGSVGTFDLEATLTHEIGHLLGLEHSSVVGATMHAHQGKNGVYNLPNFNPRTLAEDDRSGVRALYGGKADDENCCGVISGKVTLASGKPAANFHIWAEESATGRIAAGFLTDSEGKYSIEGLAINKYRLFAQQFNEIALAAEELGEVEVIEGKTTIFNKRIKEVNKDFAVLFSGFNGQISELTVPVNAGKSYLIYLAGKNLNPESLHFKSSSPFLSITANSVTEHDYGKDISVISLEINVKDEAPLGEYSIFAEDKNGKTAFLVGSLSVEEMNNPWHSRFFN